jgi:4-hydroxybenzoate polyprenyltransferase/phosphoserine phosphatase
MLTPSSLSSHLKSEIVEDDQGSEQTTALADRELPLYVDLDGTLLRSDSLLESLLSLIRTRPLYLFLVLLWILRGRAYLKQAVSARVSLDVASLPYNEDLLRFLVKERRAGRRIVLATAADKGIARQIADHLGIFSTVLASDARANLRGDSKLHMIREGVGHGSDFIYAGNSRADLPIWRSARYAILVNAPGCLVSRAYGLVKIIRVFEDGKSLLPAFIKSIRVYQWVKNLLVFVPVITGQYFGEPARLLEGVISFFAFSLCASGAYVANDLLDLEADRRHPSKKHRPLAAGDMPIRYALPILPLFCFGGLALSALLGFRFTAVLAAYLTLFLLYSFYLKRVVLLDVFALASMYILRIIGGGTAMGIRLSNWLLLFSLFLFLCLAFLKRFVELQRLRGEEQSAGNSRGYLSADLDILCGAGLAAGYMTALVMALYINSEDVKIVYNSPGILWFSCPLILYWVSRCWVLARRNLMADDPIAFAIKDGTTYGIAAISAAILLLANYL